MSFIPYIFIVYSILFEGYVLNGIELKGIERLLKNIETYLQYYSYMIPIIPACLTMQMCYIFKKKPRIMFMCSFIPCIFIILLGIQSAIFGVSFLGKSQCFGIEGFELGIISGFIYYVILFPILPLCLVFQIAYIIIKLKNKSKNQKEKIVNK